MSNLPIERTESNVENSLLLRHYNQPNTDNTSDEFDESDKVKKNEESKQARNNVLDPFYCNLHKKIFRFSSQQINNHFREHEREILLLSFYEKKRNSTLVDIYETQFEFDALCRDPFKQPHFQDILDIIQVGSGIKKKLLSELA